MIRHARFRTFASALALGPVSAAAPAAAQNIAAVEEEAAPADSAVEEEDALAAHRPLEGRGIDTRGEHLGLRGRRLDVGPARDEPQADRRNEAHRRLGAQPCVDRVRIAVELLDRDGRRVRLDRAHAVVPSRIWSVFRSE